MTRRFLLHLTDGRTFPGVEFPSGAIQRAETAEAAVDRVRVLHQPAECVNVRCKLKQWCIGCDPDGLEGCDENPWPCPTIRALAEPGPAATQATEPGGLRQPIAAAVDRAFDAWQQGLGETRPQDAVTDTVLAAVTEHLDVGEEQAWCKYCRRAWDSPAHRCESDGEQRVQQIANLRDRWLMAGPPPLGTSINRWWDKRLAELNAVLNEEQPAPLTPAEEARLAQAGMNTPGCTCGHDGMGVSWHGDDCPWRRQQVDPTA